ncbi:MAG: TonB-dependent receptor [Syntrophaceae bacterium]
MRVVVTCVLIMLLPLKLAAQTIYVIAPPIHDDSPEVTSEPTAFAQSIDMDRYAPRFATTEQVLAQAAGANVRSMGGLGSYASISMRGASAQQCLVLIDGQRLNSPAGGGVDISKIPVSGVERIDIIRGSDAALFGEAAMGGIVNIITKDPGRTVKADLSATAGSYGVAEASGFLSAPLGKRAGLALMLSDRRARNNYEFENNNGTENDTSDDFQDRRTNNALKDSSYLAKLTFHPGLWDLRFSANGTTARKEMPGIITFPTPQAYQDFSLRGYTLSAQGPVAGLDLTIDIGRTDQEDIYHDPQAASVLSRYSATATATHQAQLSLAYRHGIFSMEPRFSYLREALSDEYLGSRTRATRSAGLTLGCLPDPFEFQFVLRLDDNSEFGSRRTYRTGAAYSLTEWLKIKTNAGTGYRVPSFNELYYNHGFIVGNQGLDPEKSFSWDIGPVIERAWGGLSCNYFAQRYTDLIVYVLQSGLYYKPYNLSRSTAEGVELYAWVEPWEWLKLSGNYTFNRALDATGEPNQDGCQIPGQPRNLANLQVDLKTSLRQIGLGAYAAYNYIEGNFITRANTKKLSDRRIVNIGITMAPSRRLCLSAEVKNLMDKQVVDLRGFPLEGRTYYGTARVEF